MELFSKKTYICERCGAAYESRMGVLRSKYCSECKAELAAIAAEAAARDEAARGYMHYTRYIFQREATEEEKDFFIAHKNDLLERYRLSHEPGAVIETDSMGIPDLTGHNPRHVINTLSNACITTEFTALGGKLDGIVIKNSDVYLLAYEEGQLINNNDKGITAMSLILFTKDRRYPVIPLVDTARMLPLSRDKKDYIEKLEAMIEAYYPNVACPPMSADALKKKAKAGALPFDYSMIKRLCFDASINSDAFSDYKSKSVSKDIEDRIHGYGYTKIWYWSIY